MPLPALCVLTLMTGRNIGEALAACAIDQKSPLKAIYVMTMIGLGMFATALGIR